MSASQDTHEDAVRDMLNCIDNHPMSASSVSRDATKLFWQELVEGLQIRIRALEADQRAAERE